MRKPASSSPADRLKLFQQVCAAVHYAHQRLVVHRDIKPSNILVTADGTAKLLDFGIATILSAEPALATLSAAQMLTPDYASPEQIRGEPVTTSSDVYSLGVLLYRLLTGQDPYRLPKTTTPHELARAICEKSPLPSTVAGEDDGGARRRPGQHRAQGLGEGPAAALCVGGTTVAGHLPLSGRPAGAGASAYVGVSGIEIHPAEQARGGSGGVDVCIAGGRYGGHIVAGENRGGGAQARGSAVLRDAATGKLAVVRSA